MTGRSSIIAKIRKCLALARSANEHEAAAALARARALMDEYEITADDVELAEIEEATAKGNGAATPAYWEVVLAVTVAQAFHCERFVNGGSWCFVGLGPSAEIAGYAFNVLFRQLKRARADYIRTHLRRCKPGRKRQRADLFCEGWAKAVLSKVRHLKPAENVAESTSRYLAARYPNLATLRRREAKSGNLSAVEHRDWRRGFVDGQDAELHHGVGAGGSGPALIGAPA